MELTGLKTLKSQRRLTGMNMQMPGASAFQPFLPGAPHQKINMDYSFGSSLITFVQSKSKNNLTALR
ncbi:MAG: hypothetical protein ACOCUT_02450 [bacterium]